LLQRLQPRSAKPLRKREPAAPPGCPIKPAVENAVIARAWHEDVINQRNPAILQDIPLAESFMQRMHPAKFPARLELHQDILASDVVHHAAGGYPKVMDATEIAAMIAEF
jgi:hypothetical protein